MKRNIRQSMQALLRLPVISEEEKKQLEKIGVKTKNPRNCELIALRLFEAAQRGELSALKEVLRLDGEETQTDGTVKILCDFEDKNDC